MCVPIKSFTLFKVSSEIFLVYLDKFIKFSEYPLSLLQNYIFVLFPTNNHVNLSTKTTEFREKSLSNIRQRHALKIFV